MARAYRRQARPQLRPFGQRTFENVAIGYFIVPSARLTEVTMDWTGAESEMVLGITLRLVVAYRRCQCKQETRERDVVSFASQ
jgi:hypothetical protein